MKNLTKQELVYETINKAITCYEKKKWKRTPYTISEIIDMIDMAFEMNILTKKQCADFLDRVTYIVLLRYK